MEIFQTIGQRHPGQASYSYACVVASGVAVALHCSIFMAIGRHGFSRHIQRQGVRTSATALAGRGVSTGGSVCSGNDSAEYPYALPRPVNRWDSDGIYPDIWARVLWLDL